MNMRYQKEPNHKFFAVTIGGCTPYMGFTFMKKMKKWVDDQNNCTDSFQKCTNDELEVVSLETLNERRYKDVTVISLFTQKEVTLKAYQVGGCCDPSTERYHSM